MISPNRQLSIINCQLIKGYSILLQDSYNTPYNIHNPYLRSKSVLGVFHNNVKSQSALKNQKLLPDYHYRKQIPEVSFPDPVSSQQQSD